MVNKKKSIKTTEQPSDANNSTTFYNECWIEKWNVSKKGRFIEKCRNINVLYNFLF